MVDDTAKPNADNSTPEPAAAADPAQEAARLAAEVDTLQGQIADLTDRLLRAHAEMDNIRKRSEREREDTAKYAISKFARDVVTVADNFERAIQAVPAGAADQDPALKALVESLTMELYREEFILERRPFAPHVSLIRKARSAKLPPLPAGLDWPVDEFLLVRSALSPKGATYEPLEHFRLG